MIISCLSCGKSVSSNTHKCPYCRCEINDLTLQLNGIETKENLTERMLGMVLNLVHR